MANDPCLGRDIGNVVAASSGDGYGTRLVLIRWVPDNNLESRSLGTIVKFTLLHKIYVKLFNSMFPKNPVRDR